MSTNPLIDAIEVFKTTPAALTPEMIALLTKANQDLGERARRSHRAATQRAVEESRAAAVVALVKRALEEPTTRLAALEAQNAELRSRVLDLEADRAARAEVPDHVR